MPDPWPPIVIRYGPLGHTCHWCITCQAWVLDGDPHECRPLPGTVEEVKD